MYSNGFHHLSAVNFLKTLAKMQDTLHLMSNQFNKVDALHILFILYVFLLYCAVSVADSEYYTLASYCTENRFTGGGGS